MKSENKLKALRTLQNLTQGDLSESSGVSIRTIQRIEKGLSNGSAHTIRSLARALNVESTVLAPTTDQAGALSEDDLSTVQLINFSILSIFLIPFGNLIVPSLIFSVNKTSQTVSSLGRKIISFQIISTVILAFLTIMIFLLIDRGSGAIPLPVLICYVMYVTVSIFVVFQTAIHITKNKETPNFFPNII